MNKYLIVFAFLAFASCKQEKKEEQQQAMEGPSQMETVMAIHDEVMPRMSDISSLVADLKPKVDSSEMGIQYETAMKDLQTAHTAMMDWMRGFGDRFTSDEILNGAELSDQKQKWLDEEEEKVKALRDQINSSIENARKILEKE